MPDVICDPSLPDAVFLRCPPTSGTIWFAATPVTVRWFRAVATGALLAGWAAALRGDERCPVDCGWNLARALCGRIERQIHRCTGDAGWKVRLPYEAEWEAAVRAGTTSAWHFGDDARELPDHAWFAANAGARVHPVGTKRPNPWGLYDVYGNVDEWCADDPSRPQARWEDEPLALQRVVRGGSCEALASECASSARRLVLFGNPMNEPIGLRPVLVR